MKTIRYMLIAVALVTVASCNLDELPVDTATGGAIFGSASGMELYANSFYNILPGTDVGVFQGDDVSDIVARNGVDDLLSPGALSPITSSGWSWTALRNLNYFIENAAESTIPEKDHFLGEARFFRALFYFDKVKRFGNVPWIDKTIDVNDEATLYATRTDRFTVMDHVLADLDFAIENISRTSDATSTRITKNVARAYKTRICLFEASFRKYHTDYDMQASANTWYQHVVDAANGINGFTLHQAAAPERSYRELFITPSPFADETILAVSLDARLQVFSSANLRFISPT